MSGLGRGLGSLIPSKKNNDNSDIVKSHFKDDDFSQIISGDDERISQLSVNNIFPSPHQPRISFDEKTLNDLAESIKEHGVIQPIIVCQKGNNNYELIAGERRLKASKLAGMEKIPSIIRNFDEQKKMELALIENLQREDLNALEVAMAYRKLVDEFNLSHKELSRKVGKSEPAVVNTLRLLNLRDEVKEAIVDGRLTAGHARALAGLSFEDQLEGMENILKKKMTVREAEFATQQLVAKKNIRPNRFDPEAKDFENQIAEKLGTKIEVRRHGQRGQITIKFFSNEELLEIVNKILN